MNMNQVKLLLIMSIVSFISYAVGTPQTKEQVTKPVEKINKQTNTAEKNKANNTLNKSDDKKMATKSLSKSEKERFIPTEAISEDLAVSFPTDI